ncbi:erythrocyte membrane protein 1 (PfEMP1), truncated, putative [Plasmodium reichenowi]|uniref:Erythrocyte membrane protein 1 (PfEMP1), truncated, putative n=1 Tax=Plasmodium reichenowi TaxID=5854 RepID=A0A2P9DT01_PLARE|nr:erythrocyte membrane protein 1 (PfEMP1), truncated, putative [Plasmodium reichenowi]
MNPLFHKKIQTVSNLFRIYWKYLKEIIISPKPNHRIDIFRTGDQYDDYAYIGDISSSDITSSSESEYEEFDINDIYPYKSPKYKTLIEVVLKPSSKTYDVKDTHIDHIEDTSDTTTNKLTDNEWNQLKQNFIAQYLNHTGRYVPLTNELPDRNTYTQPNTLYFDIYDKKPFIKSIQDRFLDISGEEVTYNIHWNVPENINRTTNIMDNPKYVSNNIYTTIDLINDSLSTNHNVDIYDEVLKRKEN